MPSSLKNLPPKPKNMLIGAMLRVPAQAIHRRIIKELNAAGFKELREPHMAVLQFPGPDGVRPGTLAERAGLSKQAMNQLLRSLEGLGYIVRSDAPEDGDAPHTQKSTTYFATSSESGVLSLSPNGSLSSKSYYSASGIAR
jgi:hypothetical protein